MIHEIITKYGKLSPKHKKSLIEERGFTEEIIKSHRFFTGGKYLLDLVDTLVDQVSKDDLLASGTMIKPEKSKALIISPQLLGNRIVIPYLDENGIAYFLRPHKMGLEVPVEIYHKNIFENEDKFAIITESEFKAVAGEIFGFKTIGVPGIASFADRHFPRFMKFLHSGGIKKVCIVFDNEIKNDPAFPNYKEQPFKRYDSEYFAYIMAKNLLSEGIETKIGKLPDSWRDKGKIDLDGALAQKRTKDDIRAVISESKIPTAFIQDLSAEAKNVLSRKLAKKHLRTHISVDWGKYVANRRQGKQEWTEVISNFTIKILARNETNEGVIRTVVLVDEFGKMSPTFALPSDPMVRRDIFAGFVMSKGNYIWRGTNEDLANIWQGLFLSDDGRHIIEPDHIGWLEKDKMFLFGNIVVRDGEEIHPDKSNIFWMEKHGVRPVPLVLSSSRDQMNEGIPILSKTPIDMKDIQQRLIESIGKYEAYTILGWLSSVIFMEEVFGAYNAFPFLFVTGRRGSGKSTVAEWIMNFFGIETGGKMASDSTSVYIQRALGYYSSLPVYIDEYRNSKDVTKKNGFFRNAYNRQSAGKGIRSSFGVREGKIRGALLLAGEETPEDNALLTRCLIINILEKNRKINHFNWFQAHRSGLSYHTYDLVKRKKSISEEYMVTLHGGKDFFVKRGIDDRLALNYAVIGAGYFAAFGELPRDFQDYLAKDSSRVKQEFDSENTINVFLDDLLALQTANVLDQKMWDFDEDRIYLYFHGLYSVWSRHFRSIHGTEPFKSSAIRKYFEEEPGFLGLDHVRKIEGRPRRCVVFDRKKAQMAIRYLCQEKTIGPD